MKWSGKRKYQNVEGRKRKAPLQPKQDVAERKAADCFATKKSFFWISFFTFVWNRIRNTRRRTKDDWSEDKTKVCNKSGERKCECKDYSCCSYCWNRKWQRWMVVDSGIVWPNQSISRTSHSCSPGQSCRNLFPFFFYFYFFPSFSGLKQCLRMRVTVCWLRFEGNDKHFVTCVP